MALYVSDAAASSNTGIKLSLQNTTEIEIVFHIGEKSFTLKSGQSMSVRADRLTSIEARPHLIGVDSAFIVGGSKRDTSLNCSLETSPDGQRTLVLDSSYD